MAFKWMDGVYCLSKDGQIFTTVKIAGNSGFLKMPAEETTTLSYGSFSNPDKRGLEMTGEKKYNVKWYFPNLDRTSHGVLSSDGRKITLMDGKVLEFMDEEAQKKMLEEVDPADNPPNKYIPTSAKKGKILWISGMTGMGKTTTAKFLQDNEGFVNYEGDCFLMGLNPYVGSAPTGSSHFGTRPLTGISEERKMICKAAMEKGYREILRGNPVDPKIWKDFYDILCEDVLKEREKLGGNWVIGQAVYSKAARDTIRKRLGDDLIMVVLESREDDLQLERLAKRALGSGKVSKEVLEESKMKLSKLTGGQDKVEEDEPNTFVIMITNEMTPHDVAQQALSYLYT